MFTLSVCMIIKDEELVLGRVLDCVKQFADEIVIVDTGSTDNSPSIAKSYTEKVYHFKWCNDFALARNKSFAYATSDYIMWLDADDYIDSDNISKIIALKQGNTSIDCYMCKYAMGHEDGKPTFEYYRERIVKNDGTFTWSGFVHEAIAPHGKIEYTDIVVVHKKIAPHDPKRNLKLYRYAISQGHLLTPRETYYYGRELFYNGYIASCEKTLRKFLNMQNTYEPNVIDACAILADIYLNQKKYKRALSILSKCITEHVPTPEICCKLAETQEKLGNINLSIYWYESAIMAKETMGGFSNTDYRKFIPFIELCRLYYKLGKLSTASKYHALAKQIKPNHPSIIYNDKFFKN